MSHPKDNSICLINIDGASSGNPGDASIGVVLKDNLHKKEETISQYIGKTTNNFAEYQALIIGLERAIELGIKDVHVKSDSELLVKQLKGEYKVKSDNLKELNHKAANLIKSFSFFKIEHVRREFNKEADKLAKKAIIDFKRASRMVAP